MDIIRQYLTAIDWHAALGSALHVVLILVVFWIVTRVLRGALARLEAHLLGHGLARGEAMSESAKRAETLVRLLRQGMLILLWVVVGLMILRELGIEIAPVLASAGIAGLAIGFGAQNLVRDVISGFFMILENQVRVGDVAVVNGVGGLVEEMNFRTIVLRDISGTVHVFPNGTVTTLANKTREWSAYVFDIGIAYKEDVDRVMEIMKRVGGKMRADEYFGNAIVEDIEIFGVDDFAESAVVIKGRIKTLPIKQWEVGREYRRRLKMAFEAEGVEIPFPHRSIYFGEANRPALTELLGAKSEDEGLASLKR